MSLRKTCRGGTLTSLRTAALGLLVIASPECAADVSVSVSQAAAYDTNPVLEVEDFAESDWISTSRVRVQLDQPIGRQRFTAYADAGHQEFFRRGDLTNNPYGLGADLDWSAANLWEGELGGDHQKQLFRFSQQPIQGERNLEEVSRAWFRVRKGVVTKLSFEAAATAFMRDFSSETFSFNSQRYVAGETGVRFQPSPDLSLRTLFRYTRGSFPERTESGDDYTRQDVELNINWQPSGSSNIKARASIGKEDHSLETIRSLNVWAAGLDWNWKPSGKLDFGLSLSRDSDSGSATVLVVSPDGGIDLGNAGNTRVNTSASVRLAWVATGKISVTSRVRVSDRSLDSRRSGTQGARGTDLATEIDVGVLYRAARFLDLSCGMTYDHRSISGDVGGLSFAYDGKSGQCAAAFWIARP